MPILEEIRARAKRHDDELARDVAFLTIADLAARWHCAKNTVRAISKAALPYVNLGNGVKRELRRYHPDDVAAYETARLERAG